MELNNDYIHFIDLGIVCPICKRNITSKEIPCPNCGFDEFHMEFLAYDDEPLWKEKTLIPFISNLSSKVKFQPLCAVENDFYKGLKGKRPIYIHKDLLSYFPLELCPNEYLYDNLTYFKYSEFDYDGNTLCSYEISNLNNLKTIICYDGTVSRYTKDYSTVEHSLISDGFESYMYGIHHVQDEPLGGTVEIDNVINNISLKEIVGDKLFILHESQNPNAKNYFSNWKLTRLDKKETTILEISDGEEKDFDCSSFELKLKFHDNRELLVAGYCNAYLEELIFTIFSDECVINLFRGHLSTNDYSDIFKIDSFRAKILDEYF